MKWIVEGIKYHPYSYVIEHDEDGFYFYVYENDVNTHDYLKGDFEAAQDHAFRDFNVPKSAWVTVA